MAEADTLPDTDSGRPSRRSRMRRLWPDRWRWRASLIALIALVSAFTYLWINREVIAGDIIDDTLDSYGLEARYEIESIDPQKQVIRNLSIGDPDAPDLTIDRVVVHLAYGFGTPEIGRVEVLGARLFGSYRDGALSFGALDPVLFAESDEPAGLPQLDVTVTDGRARIDTDFGTVGILLEGSGRLDDGFVGQLAATAPGLGVEGCAAAEATAFGEIASSGGALTFEGPVRLRKAACEGANLASADVATMLSLSSDFTSLDSSFRMRSRDLAYEGNSLATLGGEIALDWDFGQGNVALRHEIDGTGFSGYGVRLDTVSADGTLRMREQLANTIWNLDASGDVAEIDLAGAVSLAEARAASEGTLLAPLLARFETSLASASRGGTFGGEMTLRSNSDNTSIIIPEARLRSAQRETILALSRVSYSSRDERLTGNVLTGGAGLPQINGRMQRAGDGDFALRMSMAEYRAGSDAIGIPRLSIMQDASGRFTFNGILQAEGAIPGGQVRGLQLPLEGTYSAAGGLAVGRACTAIRIGSVSYYDLALTARTVNLCPVDGAIVRYRDSFDFAAQTSDLELAGQLADTPARINAARAVIRYPGPFLIDGLEAIIGPQDNAVRLTASGLEGSFADEIGGTFEGGTARIDAVPLDLANLSGRWSYSGSVLTISEGAFLLSERPGAAEGPDPRFEPMDARQANLTMADGIIRADAALRHPASQRLIANVDILHNLSSGRGRADIGVPGVVFDEQLQPDDLSYLADGVIALARGTVTGEGLIEWNGSDIESTGAFRTNGLDFAAAFGPVQDVEGEIVFTDLLGLTTAPGQRLTIGSVNPGIEALGGEITFALTGGTLVGIEEGRWPFMGGTLILRETELQFGGAEGQSYVFEIVGLDAATFVAEMELDNFGAAGTFDGTIPIYFDGNGNGFIRGGLLISRAPGGNVSYIGELTYEDMGAMANFAFQALRSLDYRQMAIALDGSIAGEIITRFTIDGVTQGEGASRNFVTRELGKIPIRFNINVRSENFSQLALVVRGLSDPTAFGDAVDQGIFRFQDGVLVESSKVTESERQDPADPPDDPAAGPDPDPAIKPDEPAVQPPESDILP